MSRLKTLEQRFDATEVIFTFHDRFGSFLMRPTDMPGQQMCDILNSRICFASSIPIFVRPEPAIHEGQLYMPLLDNDQMFAWATLKLRDEAVVDLQIAFQYQRELFRLISEYDDFVSEFICSKIEREQASEPGLLATLIVNRKLRIKEVKIFQDHADSGIGNFVRGSYLHLEDLDAEKSLRLKVHEQFQQMLLDPCAVSAVTAKSTGTLYPSLFTISGMLTNESLLLRLLRECSLRVRLIDPLGDVSSVSLQLSETLGLTKKQAQIACLLALGKSPSEVAHEEGCSVETIRWHVKQIGARLGITKQPRMAAYISRVAYTLAG